MPVSSTSIGLPVAGMPKSWPVCVPRIVHTAHTRSSLAIRSSIVSTRSEQVRAS
jgi:hypothetical protein